jgi:hypothetical protein
VGEVPPAQLAEGLPGAGERAAAAGEHGHPLGGRADVPVDPGGAGGREEPGIGRRWCTAGRAGRCRQRSGPTGVPALAAVAGNFFGTPVASARVWRATAGWSRRSCRSPDKARCSHAIRTGPENTPSRRPVSRV